jgi:uncharacterized protein (TIGR01777 family)
MTDEVPLPGQSFVARSLEPTSPERLYAWHLAPGALERLLPPWDRVEIVGEPAPVAEGSTAELVLRSGPLRFRWIARHAEFVPGREFTDVALRSPFAWWRHTHRMLPAGDGSTLEDEISYELPFGALGAALGAGFVRRRLERTFRWRHAQIAADLARHGAFPGASLDLAVSGATGLVGRQLVAFLTSGGHRVRRLVRREPQHRDEVLWDPTRGRADGAALEGLDAVVHLAGENITSRRWSEAQKRRIRDSRVEGTRLLVETLGKLARPPRVLVAASAIGFYGNRGDEPLDEDSAPGSGFLAETCLAWEAASGAAAQHGIRVVQLRIGVVLSARGGMLAAQLPAFKLGGGARVASGRQWLSWIALDDLVGVIHRALLDERLAGPVNAVAPAAVTNAEFTRALARVLGRPAPLVLPAPLVRLLLGELGQELLLAGARIVPRRLAEIGHAFRFTDVREALASELGRGESHPVQFVEPTRERR